MSNINAEDVNLVTGTCGCAEGSLGPLAAAHSWQRGYRCGKNRH